MERERSAERELPPGLRCPYCHDALPPESRVVRCSRCQAAHHAGCFAEQGGCAATACGGRLATTGEARAAAGPACGVCAQGIGEREWVAWCACATVSHLACYERQGSTCPRTGCRREAEVGLRRELALRRRQARLANAALLLVLSSGLLAALSLVFLSAWALGDSLFGSLNDTLALGAALAVPALGCAGVLVAIVQAQRRARLELANRPTPARPDPKDAPPPS